MIIQEEDVHQEADVNNLYPTISVSPIPTIRIHKNHPMTQVIGNMNLAVQTRKMTKDLEDHTLFVRTLK